MDEFIVTESIGAPGEYGELQVVEALKVALFRRATMGFWKYPLNTRQGQLHGPDILPLDPEWGIVILEVKNIPMRQLEGLDECSWPLRKPYFGRTELNPYEQARRQAQAVIERIRSHAALSAVSGRALVALPRITREKWEQKIDMLAQAAAQRRDFALQQEKIAKTIPPGVQRISGIAGSGKTVLLAQKATNIYLCHPQWDIALVFFCWALYEQMQVDHWLRERPDRALAGQEPQQLPPAGSPRRHRRHTGQRERRRTWSTSSGCMRRLPKRRASPCATSCSWR